MDSIRDFLRDLDRSWETAASGPRIKLQVFGCSALLLQTSYQRLTKDSDVLETSDHTPEVKTQLELLAGRGTRLHARHRLYIEIVPNGIPFLPHAPAWHPLELALQWFAVTVLDVTDVVVSKLARFNADDRSDIDAMIEGGHVTHDQYVRRFRDAIDERSTDARADQLPKIIERFHTVERDMFGVDETEIPLPSWV